MIIPVVNTLAVLNARQVTTGGQGTPKHKAHTVQPKPTPDTAGQYRAGFMQAMGGLVLTAMLIAGVVFWFVVVRFLWKRASRPAARKGQVSQ